MVQGTIPHRHLLNAGLKTITHSNPLTARRGYAADDHIISMTFYIDKNHNHQKGVTNL